ncbi:MAG: hydantoinase/oxoprolinase family protein, partial [Chloroflexi bacterium]|nr:hydantoinase/oxoprolinase family protein [Chloroflexota bacterium]
GRGYALKLPVLDIAEVGAGGGSLATADRLGTITVGPRSAGAVPGPACYGAGGSQATVTDANVVLGYVNPSAIAGGRIRIHADLARRAIESDVAASLGLSVRDAAHGVFGVAVASMTRAVKAVTTFRGRDPRDFVLVAFGGNGPIFGTALAESLGIRRVIVPAAAGVFSALGLIEAEARWHAARSVFERAGRLDGAGLRTAFRALETGLVEELRAGGDLAGGDPIVEWSADVRYADQGYELAVAVERDGPDHAFVGRIVDAFHAAHARTYGHASERDEVEVVNVRVTTRLPRGAPLARTTEEGPAAATSRPVWFGPAHGERDVPIVRRRDLRSPLVGPLLVDELDTTTVVPPGWRASLDDQHSIVLEGVA